MPVFVFFLPGIVDEQPGLESRDRCRHVFALCSGHGFLFLQVFLLGVWSGCKKALKDVETIRGSVIHPRMLSCMSFCTFEGCLYSIPKSVQERCEREGYVRKLTIYN